ncbi:hypothetical protein [Geobacter pickeringii]|uniref:hypothetical protein n=1 Tax=Geobacter pickeringii TaxID=345632 RepID=UPI00068D17C3|nr:hypothetical protein [Geobacter pickeringii]
MLRRILPARRLGAGAVFLSGLLFAAVAAGGAESESRESLYSIFSRGFRVGELKTVCTPVPNGGKKVVKFSSTTKVNANFVFYSYALDTKEEALVGSEGAFRYRRTTREKESRAEVEGRLESGQFQFDVNENGTRRRIAIDRHAYDHTTMECPETAMKTPGERLSLRLLDLERLEVVVRHYRYVKDEVVTINGARIACKVIDFDDPHKKGRRWIRGDEAGVVIARQEGSGQGGSYSLRMTKLSGYPGEN